jgi:ketosteroid isomerase-like protein
LTPKQILHKWIDAFNKADAETISTLYSDGAVNHQVTNEPVRGKAAITEMFTKEFAAAEMVCILRISLKMVNGQYWNGKTRKG